MYAGQDCPKKAVPTNGIFDSSGISTTPARWHDRLELGVQEGGEPDHQHVEGEADDELVGRQAVAHVGLHRGQDQAGHRGVASPTHTLSNVERADRGAERAGDDHPLERDVQRAGPLCHPLPRGREDEQHGEAEGALVEDRRGEDVPDHAAAPAVAGRGRHGACSGRGHGPPPVADGGDGRGDEEGQDEHGLDDVGDPPLHAGGGQEAAARAERGEDERHRDGDQRAVPRQQGDQEALPAVVAGEGRGDPVARGLAGQQHATGQPGERAAGHQRGAADLDRGDAGRAAPPAGSARASGAGSRRPTGDSHSATSTASTRARTTERLTSLPKRCRWPSVLSAGQRLAGVVVVDAGRAVAAAASVFVSP